ncbi:hypothetical protein F383_17162 [Gossypium arboreum]|uniref:Uncharacterized protein n=1 Tax=Gossypium arboreum TaxID=29729 RepID=A0A0B0NQX7_GOSAR|nr:hypothetical protein F383_17162 [Gossypium arboreum]
MWVHFLRFRPVSHSFCPPMLS